MEITEVFYPKTRHDWRNWLETNHKTKTEIWFRTFLKASGQPSLPYDDMVEECLCFGWIDGIVKKLDVDSAVRRITPRKKKSFLSELNRQRIWKLQKNGLMTPAGIEPIAKQIGSPDDAFEIPNWILARISENPTVFENFQTFPHFYKRLKVSWVQETGLNRPDETEKRLLYLLKMTASGKMYGTQPLG